jgi:hypothetical protein
MLGLFLHQGHGRLLPTPCRYTESQPLQMSFKLLWGLCGIPESKIETYRDEMKYYGIMPLNVLHFVALGAAKVPIYLRIGSVFLIVILTKVHVH